MFVRFILALLLVSSCQLLADNQYNYENALKLYQQKQFDSAGIHLRNVLKELGFKQKEPTPIHINNELALKIINENTAPTD